MINGMYEIELVKGLRYTVKTAFGDIVDSFDTKREALELVRALTN